MNQLIGDTAKDLWNIEYAGFSDKYVYVFKQLSISKLGVYILTKIKKKNGKGIEQIDNYLPQRAKQGYQLLYKDVKKSIKV